MSPTGAEHANDVLDEKGFEAALTFLLGEAHEQGIDVVRNWSCHTEDDLPDWEVEVFEA